MRVFRDEKTRRRLETRGPWKTNYLGCIAHTRGGIACSNISSNINARTHARTHGTQSYDFSLFNVFDASLSQDAIGAPLEFLEVVDTPFELDGGGEAHGFTAATMTYTNENNRFELKRGQWTDDAAMGLCMASDAANTQLHLHLHLHLAPASACAPASAGGHWWDVHDSAISQGETPFQLWLHANKLSQCRPQSVFHTSAFHASTFHTSAFHRQIRC